MKNILEINEENTELELLGKINQILTLLDEVDKKIEELPQEQSNIELLRSDLEHLLEDKEMGSVGYKNIAKELERVRKQRRHLKKAYEIIKCYQNNKNKIIYKEQRPFVRQAIGTCFKDLQTTYNYRLLNAQDIKALIGNDTEVKVESGKKKRRTKNTCTKEELIKDLEAGARIKDLMMKYNLARATIDQTLRRMGINYSSYIKKERQPLPEESLNIKPKDVTKEMFLELKEKGYTVKEIAKYWGMSEMSVYLIKKRLNI